MPKKENKTIIGCSHSVELAKKIARKLNAPFSKLETKQFPDGDLYIRYKTNVKGKHVVLVQTLHEPNISILEAIFAIDTAKDLGAKSVTLVCPYLAYMRQDKRFHSGECVTAPIMARLLSRADRVITIDPHLHRIHKLSEVFKTKTKRLSANHAIAQHIKKNLKNPTIIGPDSESYQWAKHIAEEIKAHATVLKKKRYSSVTVRIKIHDEDTKWIKGKDVVIVDDIISTGHTMAEAAKEARKMGAKSVHCIGVHALFIGNAMKELKKAGVRTVSTVNTITHKTNKIDISGTIAKALRS